MIETAPAPGTYKGKTAEEWRAQAATEPSPVTRHHRELCAHLAESGGLTETEALFTPAGDLVAARHGWNRYGDYWALLDSLGNQTGQFFTPSRAQDPDRARDVNARKGYYVGTVKVPGKATIVDSAGHRAAVIVPVHLDAITPATVAQIVDNGH